MDYRIDGAATGEVPRTAGGFTADQRLAGASSVALGIGFNVPYAILASLYDYPHILRQPADVALRRFAEGGPVIVLVWYGFMLAAIAFIPVALWLSLTRERLVRSAALTIGAAIAGALAGLTQAIGLARWVFAVPMLAAQAETADAQRAFALLNAFGGVAIGENIGQLMTALFVAQLATLQRREGAIRLAALGGLAATAIVVGTGEGVAIAAGAKGSAFALAPAFALATVGGFAALSVWLVATGAMLLAPGQRRPGAGWAAKHAIPRVVRTAGLVIAVAGLAACGTTAGGVRGEVAFQATAHVSEFASPRSPADVATCFEQTARLLPFSLVSNDPIDGTPLYRLRYQEYWFEQIAFRRAAGGGTRVEVTSSGNYDDGWTAMLVRDRLAPLGDCIAPVAPVSRAQRAELRPTRVARR